jgi:chromosome segregation ATPase
VGLGPTHRDGPVTEDLSVGGCMVKLQSIADELGTLSAGLHKLERESEEPLKDYEQEIADFEAGMFDRYEKDEGKWPGEKTRERLARKDMDPELRRTVDRIHAARRRAERRISDLKAEADSWRSILSALKEEMAATR